MILIATFSPFKSRTFVLRACNVCFGQNKIKRWEEKKNILVNELQKERRTKSTFTPVLFELKENNTKGLGLEYTVCVSCSSLVATNLQNGLNVPTDVMQVP